MNDNVFRLAPKKQPPAVLLTCVQGRRHHFALTVTLADDAESSVSAAMMDDHQNANFNRASAPISSTTSSPRHLRPPLSSFDGPVPFAHVALLLDKLCRRDGRCAVRGAVPTLVLFITRGISNMVFLKAGKPGRNKTIKEMPGRPLFAEL